MKGNCSIAFTCHSTTMPTRCGNPYFISVAIMFGLIFYDSNGLALLLCTILMGNTFHYVLVLLCMAQLHCTCPPSFFMLVLMGYHRFRRRMNTHRSPHYCGGGFWKEACTEKICFFCFFRFALYDAFSMTMIAIQDIARCIVVA